MMSKGKKPKGSGLNFNVQMKKLQEQLVQTQEALKEEMVEASAGGGAVKIVMSGTQECHSVLINPELVASGDVEMLQDLVLLAVNQAILDSQSMAARRLGPLTGGLGSIG
jgi:DNA-binding YbaB/EbfC family protein